MVELEQLLKKLERKKKNYISKIKNGKGNPDIMRGCLHGIDEVIYEIEEMLFED